eukprot:1208611-Rhodomonas_salina.2
MSGCAAGIWHAATAPALSHTPPGPSTTLEDPAALSCPHSLAPFSPTLSAVLRSKSASPALL